MSSAEAPIELTCKAQGGRQLNASEPKHTAGESLTVPQLRTKGGDGTHPSLASQFGAEAESAQKGAGCWWRTSAQSVCHWQGEDRGSVTHLTLAS